VRLLLDENLSDKIVTRITDLFPDCTHVKSVDLTRADDAVIPDWAKQHGFLVIPKILISIREASRWVHRQSLFGCV
jgi:predicted nuclease of predicted toxin-antitoxin system